MPSRKNPSKKTPIRKAAPKNKPSTSPVSKSSSPPPQKNKNDELFELRRRINELTHQNQILDKSLKSATSELEMLKSENAELAASYALTIFKLAVASEYRDKSVYDHIKRISKYSGALARAAGFSNDEISAIELAAPMHDIGKVAIPNEILMKKGRLTVEEFAIIRFHTVTGGNMLADSDSEILNYARRIALTHHEQWNGNGYPVGLKKKKIPLVGRIVGLMDAFDALTSPRPHKDAYPIEVAVDIIRENSGRQFDPDLVDCFHDNVDKLIKIKADVDRPENLPSYDFLFSERDRN
ncbi:MAG: HD domain-containing protein [Chitinivibrionales bacterium]|nr:HD domain-containing protein [Chitinivibrionales bacterium]